MGGCPMGQYGWGAVQEEELLSAVSEAVENGINFFDTADTYGLGTSEKTLAKALGSRKNDVVIADKFGVRVENGHTFYDNSPEWNDAEGKWLYEGVVRRSAGGPEKDCIVESCTIMENSKDIEFTIVSADIVGRYQIMRKISQKR